MTFRPPARSPRHIGAPRRRTWSALVAVPAAVALSLAPGIASAAPAAPATQDGPSRADLALGGTASASSSFDNDYFGWGAARAVDGVTGSAQPSLGWSSSDDTRSNHTEWFQVDLGSTTSVNEVVLWPRDDSGNAGYGFPVDATVATSTDGTTWATVWTLRGEGVSTGQRSGTFDDQTARYVRITGTSLRSNPSDSNQYRMQFAEVEVFGGNDVAASSVTPSSASPATSTIPASATSPATAASPTTSASPTSSAGPATQRAAVAPPQRSLTPLADCYTANSDGSYTIVLGYTNPRTASVTIPAGDRNTFNPSTYNSSLPTTFEPGTQHGVAAVTVAASDASYNMSWTLDGATLNTSSNVPTCSASQLPMLANGAAIAGMVVLTGIVGAVVVRRQRRDADGSPAGV